MYNERIRSVIEHSAEQAEQKLRSKYEKFRELTRQFDPKELDIRNSMEKMKDAYHLNKSLNWENLKNLKRDSSTNQYQETMNARSLREVNRILNNGHRSSFDSRNK